jgi:hypothetical protein
MRALGQRLVADAGGKRAGGGCDRHEHRECDDVAPIGHFEGVERLGEEEIAGKETGR